MIDINVDRWIGITGVALAVAGIYLAYHFYKKSIRTKVLGYATKRVVELTTPFDGVELSYRGHKLTQLSRVYVLFWNRGTAAIERTDFVKPIRLTNEDLVLHSEVIEKGGAATFVLDPIEGTLEIQLLRPNEAIIVAVDSHVMNFRPELSIEMKSADMSEATSVAEGDFGAAALYAGLLLTPIIIGTLLIVQNPSTQTSHYLFYGMFAWPVFGMLVMRKAIDWMVKWRDRHLPMEVGRFRDQRIYTHMPPDIGIP